MQRIRDWAFPVVLVATWMLAAAYTLSLTIEEPRQSVPGVHAPQPVVDSTPTPNS